MTIWILTVVLLASLAGLGYRQGAVRVVFSLSGILTGALLAVPLGHLVKPLFSTAGMKHPVLLWLVPPFVMFVVVLTLFKIAGLAVHKKIDVYYKYRAGDLRYLLWERLHRRVGLCLGLVNGLAYLVLLSFVIYALSYWTVQVSSADSESRSVKILNTLGKDLESTGLAKVAHAVDRLPPAYYDVADTVGTLYHTPRLDVRLALYPAFLGLGERPEFQDLGNDPGFRGLWQKQASLLALLENPKVDVILKNSNLMKIVWAAVEPNLQDLNTFITTGESPRFGSEKIVGRWSFDLSGAVAALRKLRPNLPSSKMSEWKRWMAASFARASFIATPEQEVFLKYLPPLKTAGATAVVQLQSYAGQWKGSGSKYEITVSVDGRTEQTTVEIQGDRLAIALQGVAMAFQREN